MTSRLSVTVGDGRIAQSAHRHNLLQRDVVIAHNAHADTRDVGLCAHHSAPSRTTDAGRDHDNSRDTAARTDMRSVSLDTVAVLALTALARPMRGWV